MSKGKYKQAVEDFSKVIQLNPYKTDAYQGRGYAYRVLGKDDLALADFDKVMELNPKDRDEDYYKSVILKKNKK